MSLEHQMTQASADYNALQEERKKLENKVVMMRPGSINKDLLEERIRSVLGYSYSGEVVVLQSRS